MNSKTLPLSIALTFGLMFAGGLFAQGTGPAIQFPELPAASPACSIKQRIGLTDISVDYSRPGAKHRAIFGGIVPYGEVWRTGANASTKIKFSTAVKLNGVEIPKGEYALYTIPDEKEWTIIIYKDIGLWGAFEYDARQDFARIKATPVKLTDPVETFTIEFSDLQDDSGLLTLSWGRVRVPVKLEIDNLVNDIMVKIDASMSSPIQKTPTMYLQAATFYFDHATDLSKPLLWVQLGLKDNPPIAYELLYLKAKILSRRGDRAGAIEAATESRSLAIKSEGPSSSFVKMDSDIIMGVRQ